jgi:hypothetical protein
VSIAGPSCASDKSGDDRHNKNTITGKNKDEYLRSTFLIVIPPLCEGEMQKPLYSTLIMEIPGSHRHKRRVPGLQDSIFHVFFAEPSAYFILDANNIPAIE